MYSGGFNEKTANVLIYRDGARMAGLRTLLLLKGRGQIQAINRKSEALKHNNVLGLTLGISRKPPHSCNYLMYPIP